MKPELGGNGLGYDLGTSFCDYYDEPSNLFTSSIIFMCCKQLLYHVVNTDLQALVSISYAEAHQVLELA